MEWDEKAEGGDHVRKAHKQEKTEDRTANQNTCNDKEYTAWERPVVELRVEQSAKYSSFYSDWLFNLRFRDVCLRRVGPVHLAHNTASDTSDEGKARKREETPTPAISVWREMSRSFSQYKMLLGCNVGL